MITATMVVATLPVTDLDRAKAFYGNTLGLTYLWETPVAVRTAADQPAKFPSSSGVEFLDYTDGPLATTDHIAKLGPALAAWFRDPDGNTLGLRQG